MRTFEEADQNAGDSAVRVVMVGVRNTKRDFLCSLYLLHSTDE